jgi:CBS domain-containing protein
LLDELGASSNGKQRGESTMKARDVMTSQITTVTGDVPVRDAAQLMLDRGISGLPVVDANGRLCGMVSEGDLMRRSEAGTANRPRSWWLRLLSSHDAAAEDYVKTHGATVADVMTSKVTSVTPDTDVSDIAMTLEKGRIKRVPVVEGGKLVGLVSRADILRLLATSTIPRSTTASDDNAIRTVLLEHLDKQEWAAGTVNVVVQDGVINLWGLYDTDEQHQAYLVAARNAPGSKGVEDHMQRMVAY